MKLLLLFTLLTLPFSEVDGLLGRGGNYARCRELLTEMLPQAQPGKEKSEVLWRLSMASLMLGEEAPAKESKRTHFRSGIDYAALAIAEDPSNPHAYMWHCANTGRDCQTRGLKDQIAAVPVMTKDLTTILDRLGRTDYSAAWQALAELYANHPLKSNDSAVNFTRKAVATIPKGEVRVGTYLLLAQLLSDRGWSASKRRSTMSSNAERFRKKYASHIEKYSYFDGQAGPDALTPWSASVPLGNLSDAQEALALADYAIRRYQGAAVKSSADKTAYAQLVALKSKLK